jgi:hypothetical protein
MFLRLYLEHSMVLRLINGVCGNVSNHRVKRDISTNKSYPFKFLHAISCYSIHDSDDLTPAACRLPDPKVPAHVQGFF